MKVLTKKFAINKKMKLFDFFSRRISDSPPPLPDLKLFDEAPKNSDFNRSRSGGSLRKSKRDLKPPVNPNWL